MEHRLHGAQAPRSTGSTEHRLHGAQAPWSTGSTEPRMAAYHINGNTIHSMILANEHRSLGPIFEFKTRKLLISSESKERIQGGNINFSLEIHKIYKICGFQLKICRFCSFWVDFVVFVYFGWI